MGAGSARRSIAACARIDAGAGRLAGEGATGLDCARLSQLATSCGLSGQRQPAKAKRLGGHSGLGGVFELLEFGDDASLTTVLLESTIHDHIVRGPQVRAVYRPIVDYLLATGLRGAEAIALVRRIRDELDG